MTNPNSAAQAATNNTAQHVLTDDEIMRSAISACDSLNITRFHEIGAPSKTIMDDAGLLELGRAIESALLSKLRAPVADERAAFARAITGRDDLERHQVENVIDANLTRWTTWRAARDYYQQARAALSAAQAEQGERHEG